MVVDIEGFERSQAKQIESAKKIIGNTEIESVIARLWLLVTPTGAATGMGVSYDEEIQEAQIYFSGINLVVALRLLARITDEDLRAIVEDIRLGNLSPK